MFGAVKSVDLKLKVGTEFPNVWGEYKHHSNPYIHSTIDYTDRGHAENDRYTKYSLQVDTIAVTSLINPRRMRSKGYSTWSVILSVCSSVTTFSATTRNKVAKKRYQWVQCHTGLI